MNIIIFISVNIVILDISFFSAKILYANILVFISIKTNRRLIPSEYPLYYRRITNYKEIKKSHLPDIKKFNNLILQNKKCCYILAHVTDADHLGQDLLYNKKRNYHELIQQNKIKRRHTFASFQLTIQNELQQYININYS